MQLQDIKRIGIAGAGTMGFGFAINFALAGYPVTMYDLTDEVLKQSMDRIKSALSLFVEEYLLSREQADEAISRIGLTTSLEIVANNDFITEAIIERVEDKIELFKTLDGLCPPQTIIASNTSSLVLSEFTTGLERQDKVVLTHYFAPPHIVPGVEVAKGPKTSDETYEITYALIKNIGKTPIRVLKEMHGYLLNRIQGAATREAMRLWAEGVASAEDIELGVKTTFGFRMPHEGPMGHYDVAGIWKWPPEVTIAMRARSGGSTEGQSPEVTEKIRARMAEGKPWFVDPAKYNEALLIRDREYIRRLKTLYPHKD